MNTLQAIKMAFVDLLLIIPLAMHKTRPCEVWLSFILIGGMYNG
jgi:hypothetical protein